MRDFGGKQSSTSDRAEQATAAGPGHGKRTLTEILPSESGPRVQRKADASTPAPAMPCGPRPTLDELFGGAQRVTVDELSLPVQCTARGVPFLQLGGPGSTALIQQRASGVADDEPAAVHEAAQKGIATAASPLPHLEQIGAALVQRKLAVSESAADVTDEQVQSAADHATTGPSEELPHRAQIQRAFGRHDVSDVRAYRDERAQDGAHAMGAAAFATGDRVAFAGTPDLHTAAHEAAHVVQQRAGVHLNGGVGRAGDDHERHADAVADAVTRGASAEPLLDGYCGAGSATPGGAVQRVLRILNPSRTLYELVPDTKEALRQNYHATEAALDWLDEIARNGDKTYATWKDAVDDAIRRTNERLGTSAAKRKTTSGEKTSEKTSEKTGGLGTSAAKKRKTGEQLLITNWYGGERQDKTPKGMTWEESGLPPFVDYDQIEITCSGGVVTAKSQGIELGELDLYEDENGGRWINNIEVKPWARRKGVATMLVKKAIKEYGAIYASTQSSEDDTSKDTRHLEPDGQNLVEKLIAGGIMQPEWYTSPVK